MVRKPETLRKDLLVVLAGLAFGAGLGIFFFYLLGIGDPTSRLPVLTGGRNVPDSPSIGKAAPDFELQNLSGESVRLSELRGRVVIINFWATWCGPCRLEMPAIQARYDRHPAELEVLAVNFDEPQAAVQAFVNELGLTFTVLLDPGAQVQDLYRVRGYPTTYLVDPDGVVREVHIGLMTEKQLDAYLVQLGVNE
ncbi:MAG TPA: redoxin domain-containing protein [Anaerolineales bacterium]|nr:redoxin domain-containing protein [Anaerolineales bacterium]